jgi:hypothetical protein
MYVHKKIPVARCAIVFSIAALIITYVIFLVLFPKHTVVVDSCDRSLVNYRSFVFPIYTDASGVCRLLTGFSAYPSGGGSYAVKDPIKTPWPIVPAPLTFRSSPFAKRVGWIVRRTKVDINKPDDSEARVYWMTPEEVSAAIDAGRVIIPKWESLPKCDLSKLIPQPASRTSD